MSQNGHPAVRNRPVESTPNIGRSTRAASGPECVKTPKPARMIKSRVPCEIQVCRLTTRFQNAATIASAKRALSHLSGVSRIRSSLT